MIARDMTEATRAPGRQEAFTVPNILSLVRIVLIPFFLWAMIAGRPVAAFILFSAAAATDFLDGWTARLLRQKSALGLWLDPAADKLLMTAAFIICSLPRLSWPNSLPAVVTAVVIGRDAAIVLGAWILYKIAGKKSFAPSLWGKISTICQMVCLFFVLLSNALGLRPAAPLAVLLALTLAATAVSGGHYFWTGFLRELVRRRQMGRGRF